MSLGYQQDCRFFNVAVSLKGTSFKAYQLSQAIQNSLFNRIQTGINGYR
jgi:hypothetical protein